MRLTGLGGFLVGSLLAWGFYLLPVVGEEPKAPGLLPPIIRKLPAVDPDQSAAAAAITASLDAQASGQPSASDLLPPPPRGDFAAALSGNWDPPFSAHGIVSRSFHMPQWYVSAAAVIMRPDGGGDLVASFDGGTGQSVLTGDDVRGPAAAGVEVSLARWSAGSPLGIGFTYWGLYPATQSAEALGTDTVGLLHTSFDFTGLSYSNGSVTGPLNDWFDDVVHQEIRRRQEWHNLELSFLGARGSFDPWGAGGKERTGCGWLVGIRYIRLGDDFELASDDVDTVFAGDVDEVTYDVRTQNDLLGLQVGGGANWRLRRNLNLYSIARIGLYGVHARQEQFLVGGNGLALVGSGPFAGEVYAVQSSSTNVALVGQLDVGGQWQFHPRFSAQLAYRLVGVEGVALVEDQIPSDFSNLAQARRLDNSGSLVLHGAFIGVTCSF